MANEKRQRELLAINQRQESELATQGSSAGGGFSFLKVDCLCDGRSRTQTVYHRTK